MLSKDCLMYSKFKRGLFHVGPKMNIKQLLVYVACIV